MSFSEEMLSSTKKIFPKCQIFVDDLSQCCGSESEGSVRFWASRIRLSEVRIPIKILRSSSNYCKKNLYLYFYDFFMTSLRNNINAPLKSNQPENMRKKIFFFASRRSLRHWRKEQDPEPDPEPIPLVRGTDPRIRIRVRTKTSRIWNTDFFVVCVLAAI